MLTAIIILSLISLLVATEADPSSARHEPAGDPPLRPAKKKDAAPKLAPRSNRLAA